MGFEKELLCFQATKTDSDLPEDLAPTIRLLLQSKTIEEAILIAQSANPGATHNGRSILGFSYLGLFKSLQWLRDHRILKNPSIHRFIDNSQSEYVWPRSLLKFPILELTLWNKSKASRTKSIGFTPWVLFFPVFLIFVGIVWSILKSFVPLSQTDSPSAPLYSFFLIFITVSVLRTGQAVAVGIMHELLGLAQSLKWVITPLSINFEIADRSHPKVQVLLARTQIMIAALSPLFLWSIAAGSKEATPTLYFATGIWLLSEFSPFTNQN